MKVNALSFQQIHQSILDSNAFSACANKLNISSEHLAIYLRTCTFQNLRPFVFRLKKSELAETIRNALGEAYYLPITLDNIKLLNHLRMTLEECFRSPENINLDANSHSTQFNRKRNRDALPLEDDDILSKYIAPAMSLDDIDDSLNKHHVWTNNLDTPGTPSAELIDEQLLDELLNGTTERYDPVPESKIKKTSHHFGFFQPTDTQSLERYNVCNGANNVGLSQKCS